MKMIFLVDGDNNIGTGLQGADQLTAEDSILIFYQKTGLALSKIKELCKGSKASIQYLESVKGGKNSIDFQIITELGVLVGRGEADCAYVISQDKGYEAAMSALRARYAGAFREVALRPSIAACLKASYLLRAASAEELRVSLQQEFGEVQGLAAFGHLQRLFRPAGPGKAEKPAEASVSKDKPAASPAAEEKPAADGGAEKAAKKSHSGRRRAAKAPGVNPAEAGLEKPAAQPAPKAAASPPKAPAAPKPAAATGEKSAPKLVRAAHRGSRRKKKPAAEKPAGEA